MKKTTDEELNQWKFDQTSAPVSVRFVRGDDSCAAQYAGFARSLLWITKNNAKLAKIEKQDQWMYPDGTRIRVSCGSGIDIIEIECAPQAAAAAITCCQNAKYASPIIQYTSLQMNVSDTQNLNIQKNTGCPPFTWQVLSGNGSITIPNSQDTSIVTYQAPDSNPDCPPAVIQVTDSCGNTNSIQVAISANVGGIAYRVFHWGCASVNCPPYAFPCCDPFPCGVPLQQFSTFRVVVDSFLCDGSAYSGGNDIWPHFGLAFHVLSSTPPTKDNFIMCEGQCLGSDASPGTLCGSNCGALTCYSRKAADCIRVGCATLDAWGGSPGYDGEAEDLRTDDMKAQGCCPINPETGLLF